MKNSLVFLIFMKYCKKKKRFSYDLFCEYLLQWDKDSVFKQKHGKFLADLARVGDEALLAWDGPGLGRGFPKSMLLNDTEITRGYSCGSSFKEHTLGSSSAHLRLID